VEEFFDEIFHNNDGATYALARRVLDGEHTWLESGIVDTHRSAQQVPNVGDRRPSEPVITRQ
jgi:hypothetical protein